MNKNTQQITNERIIENLGQYVRHNLNILFYTDELIYQPIFNNCFTKNGKQNQLVHSYQVFDEVTFKNEIKAQHQYNCINIALKYFDAKFINDLIAHIYNNPASRPTLFILWCHKPDELLHFETIRKNPRFDIRDITQITPQWVEWVNYINLHHHINRLNTHNVDILIEQEVIDQNRALTDINYNLQQAIDQNVLISSKLREQFEKIEKQNIEINKRNEELEKAFKKSSSHHIKLQKALLVNEQQRIKLEKTLEENKQKNEKLQAQNEEIKSQRDHIQFQTEEIESQRDMAIMQRDQIILQQNEIRDNIQYASRIQYALLPQLHF
jgi:hypothetical protein